MQALGVTSMPEAISVMQAMGMKPEDVPAFLAQKQREEMMANVGGTHGLLQMQSENQAPPAEPIKLTRRQQLGVDPIPPEVLQQIEQQKMMEEMRKMEQEMILA